MTKRELFDSLPAYLKGLAEQVATEASGPAKFETVCSSRTTVSDENAVPYNGTCKFETRLNYANGIKLQMSGRAYWQDGQWINTRFALTAGNITRAYRVDENTGKIIEGESLALAA